MSEDISNVAVRLGNANQIERGTPVVQPQPHTKQTATISDCIDDAVALTRKLQSSGVGSSQDVDNAKGVDTFNPANVATDHLTMRVFQATNGLPENMIAMMRQLIENAIDKLASRPE